ncbi:hypothetical protein MY7_3618 [Bacillus sp. 5B6]|nr:hypothetical protein MY7_3618 [Bacillus sp. 5B6]
MKVKYLRRKRKLLPCKSVPSAVRDIQTTVLESQGMRHLKQAG